MKSEEQRAKLIAVMHRDSLSPGSETLETLCVIVGLSFIHFIHFFMI